MFDFPDGRNYQHDEITLKPYQSISIDIKKLRASGKHDVLGRPFPADAAEGQLYWIERVPNTMIGRAEQTNPESGAKSSFSCTLCCDNYGWWGFVLTPGSAAGAPGGNQ